MNIQKQILTFILFFPILTLTAFAETSVIETMKSGRGEDSAVVIQKTSPGAILPDYEIIGGSDEINGDPTSGTKPSYESWKVACSDWKQDMKKMNGDNLISLSCGTGKTVAQETGSDLYITKSIGTYKVRARIKDTGSHPTH